MVNMILNKISAMRPNFIAVDAWVNHYYSRAYVFGELLYRLGSGVLIAVIVATAALPMAVLLRRQGLARA